MKQCFVISPIGEPGSDERERTDRVFEYIIQPAVGRDYEAILPHHINLPGKITIHVIERIVTAPLLIADLTDSNANVYYELSLRHALNAPAILLIEEGQKDEIPFDLQGHRTVRYDLTDPKKIDAAINDLAEQIASVEEDASQEKNVISEHLTLIPEPQGPPDSAILVGILLSANRFRFELIDPYLEGLLSLEKRNEQLQTAFASVMREAAQKTWMQRQTVLSAFKNTDLRGQVASLFDEVETIIPPLTDAMNKGDEKAIKKQLLRWRGNNTAFFRLWVQQYSEWVSELPL